MELTAVFFGQLSVSGVNSGRDEFLKPLFGSHFSDVIEHALVQVQQFCPRSGITIRLCLLLVVSLGAHCCIGKLG